MTETAHASAAVVGARGVLIRGAAGSGKSSLLLGLLFGKPPALLVADDRVMLSVEDGRLFAAPPEAIAGLIEVRGVGIVRLPFASRAEIALVVDILPLAECPRLPDDSQAKIEIAGVMLRRIFVAAGTADGAFRVHAAMTGMTS